MRSAAKFFTVVAIIANVIIGVYYFSSAHIFYDIHFIVISTFIGLFSLAELSQNDKKPSTALSVLNLIGCSPIAGIMMLNTGSEKAKKAGKLCEQCGKHDVSVREYSIKSYLGNTKKNLCPECLKKIDQQASNAKASTSTPNSNNGQQCQNCFAFNSRVAQYHVKTPSGFVTQNLCMKCKDEFEMQGKL